MSNRYRKALALSVAKSYIRGLQIILPLEEMQSTNSIIDNANTKPQVNHFSKIN